eukprot:TRINITY_DN30806_c0_g1_i1.p1 TRINITY_DN30806_c0_g1~~TRINITY_DN30806_c0_g1_i1.p1  ORF type:complete len:740 (-),score=151.82 TRINITY_DN30806_c0_g1_i1:176-2395(-)
MAGSFSAQRDEEDAAETFDYDADGKDDQTVYEGFIKSFDAVKGFGFIRCAALQQEYSCDTFLHNKQFIVGMSVGDKVNFTIRLNNKGQPQALNLTKAGAPREEHKLATTAQSPSMAPAPAMLAVPAMPAMPAMQAMPAMASMPLISSATAMPSVTAMPSEEREHRKRYEAALCYYSPEKEYGFLHEASLYKRFNCNVFIHAKQIGDLEVGEMASFAIKLTSRGKPQAIEVRRAPTIPRINSISTGLQRQQQAWWNAWWQQGEQPVAVADDSAGRTYEGIIKKTDASKGFGFISCAELYNEFSTDVFVPFKLLGGRGVGTKIRFKININRHNSPQAFNIMDAEDKEEDATEDARGKRIVHHGIVKMVDMEKGFGFVRCQELYELYRSDIFVDREQIEGFKVGDAVSFCVLTGKKEKKPKAIDLRPQTEEEGAEGETDAKDGADRMTGVVKSFDTERGYGFLTCADAREKFDRDVFVHATQIKSFKVGDGVSFSVRINNQNQPQGYDLAAAPNAVAKQQSDGDPEKKPDAKTDDSGEEFEGEVKTFNPSTNYGFVSCERVHELYDRDCFIHGSQLEDIGVGDKIKFRVVLRRGFPSAQQVVLIDRSERVETTAAPVNPYEDLEPEVRDKKLMRACASACVESVDDISLLLDARADPNGRDVTGQSALMVSALNVRHGEKKCRMLIARGADPNEIASGSQTVVQWARERVNPKFANFLVAVHSGDQNVDYVTALDRPGGDDD